MSTTLSERHEFALYYGVLSSLSTLALGTFVELTDPQLAHRLRHVVRLRAGESFVLFDDHHHARFRLASPSDSRELRAELISFDSHKPLQPLVYWLVPLLEREPFEEALSLLTVLGTTIIQPLVTHKTHRSALYPKDYERLRRIMIAAAEQSKQFALPELKPVITFESLPTSVQDNFSRIFFDSSGSPACDMLVRLRARDIAGPLICLVGPEGDLTTHEKAILKELNFYFYSLTPTVLRSQHAITIGMGIIRSLLS
jgi:RsmE family RNA methyltransferase